MPRPLRFMSTTPKYVAEDGSMTIIHEQEEGKFNIVTAQINVTTPKINFNHVPSGPFEEVSNGKDKYFLISNGVGEFVVPAANIDATPATGAEAAKDDQSWAIAYYKSFIDADGNRQPGKSKAHHHNTFREIYFILQGTAIMSITKLDPQTGQRVKTVEMYRPGQCIHIEMGDTHQVTSNASVDGKELVLAVSCHPRYNPLDHLNDEVDVVVSDEVKPRLGH